MNILRMKDRIHAKDLAEVEALWVQGVEQKAPLEQFLAVLEALVAAEHHELAETLAWSLLEERLDPGEPAHGLPLARAVVSVVPDSTVLREKAVELYRQVHGQHEHFDQILQSSGLAMGQGIRGALQTLDVCLRVTPESYVANRYEHNVFRVQGFDALMGEYLLIDADSYEIHLEPKKLAAEYDPVAPDDFRVLYQHRRDELAALLDNDPAAVLIGVCRSHGGEVDSNTLKDRLVPDVLSPAQWSKWWSRARTASKKTDTLSLEGRNPVIISWHPHGRTLEEELAPEVDAAKLPMERLDLLRRYARETQQRGATYDPAFAQPLMDALADQARQFRTSWVSESLKAVLAIDAALESGAPEPQKGPPAAGDVLKSAEDPAAALAELSTTDLWDRAMAVLEQREDAPDLLRRLLGLADARVIDDLAARLAARGRQEDLDAAVADALVQPREHVQILIWLWKGPQTPPTQLPSRMDQFSRLLAAMEDMHRDYHYSHDRKRELCRQIRSALGNLEGFREVLESIEEPLAATLKRRIERNDGITAALREQMLTLIRDRFYRLFLKERVATWADENILWTTEAGYQAKEAELKELVEFKLPANSRAIGAAAALGDLSENSEWKFAIEERTMLQGRQAKLQDELTKARLLHPDEISTDAVSVGCRVTLQRIDTGTTLDVTFLGVWDSDIENRVYSYKTTLGQTLMGKVPGDIVTLSLEGGEADYRIDRIANALKADALAGRE